jgi:hypothetical protein
MKIWCFERTFNHLDELQPKKNIDYISGNLSTCDNLILTVIIVVLHARIRPDYLGPLPI